MGMWRRDHIAKTKPLLLLIAAEQHNTFLRIHNSSPVQGQTRSTLTKNEKTTLLGVIKEKFMMNASFSLARAKPHSCVAVGSKTDCLSEEAAHLSMTLSKRECKVVELVCVARLLPA